MLFDQITIIGVGLIGGSVGLAAKARKIAGRVVGFGRNGFNLEKARALGAIDTGTTELQKAVQSTELVVVCTPVDRIATDVLAAAAHAPASAVITDAGSTKARIVAAVHEVLPSSGPTFVGSHPLAGSEKTGVEHARANLFDDRVVIVTPTEQTDATAIDRVESFWSRLGARVMRMWPADHDRALATTSHLPHAVAAAVAALTPPDWLKFTAGGFRDVTRIAAGDPTLWAGIFLDNRDSLDGALSRLTAQLQIVRRMLTAGDREGLVRWLSEAKKVRDALGT
jgi:prephenate dehydrogenase